MQCFKIYVVDLLYRHFNELFLILGTDQAEQDFFMSLMADNLGLAHVWIGLTDDPHKFYYEKWINGEDVEFTYWDKHEPNALPTEGFQCVHMWRKNGRWNDASCSQFGI